MKVLIYSDVHFSQDSSIVRSMGEKYSTRLEYLIKSLNWAEELAIHNSCDLIVNLGDTFDKSSLNAMEISAFKEVFFVSRENTIGLKKYPQHIVLVGNHDSNVASLSFTSADLFKDNSFEVIKKPVQVEVDKELVDEQRAILHFLPYITEDNRKDLSEYFNFQDKCKHIIFSHNDIKGIQLGKFISKEGFDIEDINKSCDLFLNGHLHNSSWINHKILNVGNLCGQNFSEDNFKTKHGAWILDVDTLSLTFYENPYALNFYKIEINKQNPSLSSYDIGNNACLMIKCERACLEKIKEELNNRKDIVASKIIVYNENIVNNDENSVKIERIDYLKSFYDFIIDKLGNSDIIRDELEEICK